MADAHLAILNEPTSSPLQSLEVTPGFALACALTLVALAGGCLLPLHLLGALNIVFGYPAITRSAVVAASFAGLCLAALAVHRFKLVRGQELRQIREEATSKGLKTILAATLVPYAAFFLIGLWSFPNGCDPIAYHIDIALKWLQNASMSVNPALGWKYSLPSNGELPALIALSVGAPGSVAIGNLLAAALLAISVYLIAWKLTRQNSSSAVAAVIAATVPMVIFQAFELFVDLFGSAFLMAALALLIWRDQRRLLYSFMAGLAAGIAIGSKPTFWIYGSIYCVAALAAILRTKRHRLQAICLLAAGIALPSGFWFFRLAAATGNPVYPMRIRIGQREIFRGYARSDYPSDGFRSFQQVLTEPWSDPPLIPQLDASLPSSVAGTGPLFAAIAVPGVLFLFSRLLMLRTGILEGVLLLGLAAACALWNTVLLRVLRFGLPVTSLTCALAAPMIRTLLHHSRRAFVSLILVGGMMNGLCCLATPAQRTALRIRHRDWSRATYYGYPPLIDRLPAGSRILDRTGEGNSFMLVGAHLSNYVLPRGDPQPADYVVKAGPADSDDAALKSGGAALVYDAVPPSLYPKTALHWRVYRVAR